MTSDAWPPSWAGLHRRSQDDAVRAAQEAGLWTHGLAAVTGPAAPGSVVVVDGGPFVGRGSPGSTVRLVAEVRNAQATAVIAAPALSPLVAAAGTTWYPEAAGDHVVVGPGSSRPVELRVSVPPDLPAGTYRGRLLVDGFGPGEPLAIDVMGGEQA